MRQKLHRRVPTWVALQVAQLGGLLCAAVLLIIPAVQSWSDDIDEKSPPRHSNHGRQIIVEYNSKTRPGCTIKELSKAVLTCKDVRFVDGFGERD